MLAKIVEAHNGELPDYVKVVFANTGLEHPATLDYVREVSDRITPVTWVEYREVTEDNPAFKIVTYETASRKGEPMEAIIRKRNYLPNVVSRYCTAETKIRSISRYIKTEYGWTTWTDLIGLRADEPRRVHRLKADGKRDILCPIYTCLLYTSDAADD
jgi:3'-phosphoadenosine 5'-phosphosulfate sulfotransferase (PAPS reductase)/FAD synthetase